MIMWYSTPEVVAIIVLITINDIVTLISVYLSFRWGHEIYETKCCYKVSNKRIEQMLEEKILKLSLTDNDSMHIQMAKSLLTE